MQELSAKLSKREASLKKGPPHLPPLIATRDYIYRI